MAETIKGINIKLSFDGKDLDNQLKEINKDLKEQQKDLRAINTNLKYDSSNIELWRKKQTQLNEILNTTKKRLDTQNKALEKAKEGVKLGTVSETEFRKMQRNVFYSEADIKRLNNELGKTKDKIKDLGNVKFDNLAKVGGTLTKSLTFPILGAVTALTALADDKYFISLKRIINFTDMKSRNGFIRGVRFKPHHETSPYAYTICTSAGNRVTDNFIIVPENTKLGYRAAEIGDGIYTNRTSKKRGVVQKNAIPKLKTSVADLAVVVEKDELISIRRLTPRECFRLMGWHDEKIDLIINEFSDTQLYKMAGNSTVVNVLVNLFSAIRCY